MNQPKPILVLIAGLPATGKTWFAKALSEKSGVAHLNSDAIRAELGMRGKYDAASKKTVYEAMMQRCRDLIKQGQSVIVDSTFYREELRKPWEKIAEEYHTSYYWIVVEAPEDVVHQRLQKRRKDSEADWEVYRKLSEQWEDFSMPHLTLDSGKLSLAGMVNAAEEFIQGK